MKIECLAPSFTVCKPKGEGNGEKDLPAGDFVFFSRTDEELSLVCPTEKVPAETTEREDGWRAFRVCGVLDFSLVGILAGISGTLAGAGIGLFVVSTFNTDYILVKEENFSRALAALEAAGYEIVKTGENR